MMVGPLLRAESVEDQPPGAIVCFDQVGVACPLKRMGALIAMRQDRVIRTWFKRPPGTPAACQCLHMSIFCLAFSNQKIIPVTNMIEVGSFGKASRRATPQQACLRQLLPALAIYFALIDALLLWPPGSAGQIDVLTIKTQRRINAALLDPDRF